MRILRWMCGKTRKIKIKNEQLLEQLEVESIGEKIRETRLKWFEYVRCRPVMTPIRKSLAILVDGPTRGSGRSKKT